jgi:hypothetical protein
MSRKSNKRPARRRSFPWLLLIIGGALLAVAALLWANRGGANTGGTPSISVDPEIIEYGEVTLGTNKVFTIAVTNTGTGTLRFQEKPYIEVVEGC